MLPERNNFKTINRSNRNRKKYIYSIKAYKNPFFQNKITSGISRKGLKTKSKLTIFAIFIIILIFIWLLFFSTLFKIQTIEVNGIGDNKVIEIKSIALNLAENRLLVKNNLLLYDKNKLIKKLNEKYFLDNLEISKKLFHTLVIKLQEKKQIAVWREDEQYYYLDDDGNIINQLDPLYINGSNYPLIENQTLIKIDGRKANIDKETVDYILILFNEFKEEKFEIERFIIDREINTVKMKILSGPKVYFNTKTSARDQISKLDLIIKDKPGNDLNSIGEYIDLRYANNIYIK